MRINKMTRVQAVLSMSSFREAIVVAILLLTVDVLMLLLLLLDEVVACCRRQSSKCFRYVDSAAVSLAKCVCSTDCTVRIRVVGVYESSKVSLATG
jgi:hypothetical protein